MREQLAAFEGYLREHQLRLTPGRRRVAEKLISVQRHVAADELMDLLRKDRTPVPKATVYRTLAIMRKCGYFDAHDFGMGKKMYESTAGRNHHDHLYCISCGAVLEFQEPRIEELQEVIARRHRFTPVHHSHKIFGYCARCRGKAPRRGGSA